MEAGFSTDQLAAVARAELGAGRRLVSTDRLRGGSKKGVYRLTFDDDWTVIGYAWHPSQDYWPPERHAAGRAAADPFARATGSELFESCHEMLSRLGVRTPHVYLLDRSRTASPADIALIEDVRGGTLERQLRPAAAEPHPALATLGAALQRMHQHHGPHIGKIGSANPVTSPDTGSDTGQDTISDPGRTCEEIVLSRAISDLAQAAAQVPRLAAAHDQLAATARELAAAVCPRTQYALIHGELGPDHVLLDDHGQPVIINIEGLMYFDIEWEHVFLERRFGDSYRWLRQDGLDAARLQFYRLAMYLSLVAGPLRLLDGDFPDHAFMIQIAEHNTARALAFLD